MTEPTVGKAELTADLFHMLIKELHGVQDEVQNMRADLGRILLPNIEDITPDTIQQARDRLTEQDIVRSLCGRKFKEHAFLADKIPDEYVKVLKDNGFSVSRLADNASLKQEPSTIIAWGGTRRDVRMLHSWWTNPEDYVDL